MPLNFSNPVTSQDRAAVLQSIRDHVIALSKMLDGETLSGTTPVGAIRYNAGNVRFEKWSGVAWAELPLNFLPLAGGTLAGTLTGAGATFTSLSISGNAVWHAGNFNPANYLGVSATARRANAIPTADPNLGVGDIFCGNNTLTFADSTDTLRSVWHSGNFNPASYQLAASAWNTGNFNPNDYQPLSTAWNTLNFNPGLKANLSGATFTGNVLSTTQLRAPTLYADTNILLVDNGSGAAWTFSSSADTLRFWHPDTGDRFTVAKNGNATVAGNFTAGGNIGAYSDRRLKVRVDPFHASADDVFALSVIEYTRIDTGAREVGLFADEVQRVMPLAVRADADGMLSLDYGRFAAVAVVSLIRELGQRGLL